LKDVLNCDNVNFNSRAHAYKSRTVSVFTCIKPQHEAYKQNERSHETLNGQRPSINKSATTRSNTSSKSTQNGKHDRAQNGPENRRANTMALDTGNLSRRFSALKHTDATLTVSTLIVIKSKIPFLDPCVRGQRNRER
jgi:hypothetical protein